MFPNTCIIFQTETKELNVTLSQKYILLQKTNEKDVRLGVQIRQ